MGLARKMANVKNTTINDTGFLAFPSGNTVQRPGNPTAGMMRYNTSLKRLEFFNGSLWGGIPDIIKSNLVLYLDAGEPASYPGSGTTWTDLNGNNISGTLLNGPGFNSDNGGSIVFDGVNDTVSVTKPNPNVVGYITFGAWVRFNNYSSSPNIIHKGSHYTLQLSSTTDRWTYADSSNYSYANFGSRTVSGLHQTSTWMNLTVVKEISNDVKLYKNGTLVDTRTAFGSALSSVNTTLWISGYSDTDSQPADNRLNGNIGQVFIYNRPLTAIEIQQNFNATRARFGI